MFGNVGVVKRSERLRLALEADEPVPIVREPVWENL